MPYRYYTDIKEIRHILENEFISMKNLFRKLDMWNMYENNLFLYGLFGNAKLPFFRMEHPHSKKR